MATAHWRAGYSVAELYSQPDADWSFHQLVRLLLGSEIDDKSLLDVLENKVEFVGSLDLNLPPGEVRRVEVASDDSLSEHGLDRFSSSKHKVECAHYNLTGLDGPLAEPFLDMLREDERIGNGAMFSFINIFNNRIHALRYIVHSVNNFTLTHDNAANNFVGQFLLSLSGHFYQEQRDFHGQKDGVLMALSGHLGNCRMSLPIVRKLFLTVMQLPVVEMKSLIGRWLNVQPEDHTRLGNVNHRLGDEATLGKKIWDQQAVIELVLGSVDMQRRSKLLPGGEEHQQLKDLIAWICERRCDCKVTLLCLPDPEKNATQLSRQLNLTNRLGYGAALMGLTDELTKVSFMLNLVH